MNASGLVTRHIDRALAFMSAKHGVEITRDDIEGRSRNWLISHARKRIAASIYKTGALSQTEIGNVLGGRDHSTVHYMIETAGEVIA